jgi:hypothetical protein
MQAYSNSKCVVLHSYFIIIDYEGPRSGRDIDHCRHVGNGGNHTIVVVLLGSNAILMFFHDDKSSLQLLV